MVAAHIDTGFEDCFATLEREIVALAIRVNAVTFELLERIARLDEMTSWANLGFHSCAHWLNYRVGIDLGAAREKVRVAKALRTLPRTRAAMRSGALSYAKARAITRIATPENEADLLNIAEHGTASHVEKTVRLFRRTEAMAQDEAKEQHEGRCVESHFDESGMYVLRARLTAEQGALVDKALSIVQDELYREQRDAAAANETPSRAQRLADALERMARAALAERAHEHGGGDAFQVVVHVDAATLAGRSDSGPCAVEGVVAISAESARRLSCDATSVTVQENADGNALSLGRKRRIVSRSLRRALLARDGGCRFPGCTAARHLQAHHVRHWTEGGETSLANSLCLCSFHHHLVHEGGFSVREVAGGALEFRDRAGRVLPATPSPRAPVADLDWLPVVAEAGLVNELATWNGEPMNYGMALEGLLR